jgi:hypothetical protein
MKAIQAWAVKVKDLNYSIANNKITKTKTMKMLVRT